MLWRVKSANNHYRTINLEWSMTPKQKALYLYMCILVLNIFTNVYILLFWCFGEKSVQNILIRILVHCTSFEGKQRVRISKLQWQPEKKIKITKELVSSGRICHFASHATRPFKTGEVVLCCCEAKRDEVWGGASRVGGSAASALRRRDRCRSWGWTHRNTQRHAQGYFQELWKLETWYTIQRTIRSQLWIQHSRYTQNTQWNTLNTQWYS